MSGTDVDMTTDAAWEEWATRDPYFGVITEPRFRRSVLDEEARRAFFETGEGHVDYLFSSIREHIDPAFAPRTILDFGCGVGRLLIPFALLAHDVVGLDVSHTMLLEARRNCDERKLHNVRLLISDDRLSTLKEAFDFVHSCIVFQHIPLRRGTAIFSELLRHLRPGGVGAIQLVYSKAHYAETDGVAPPDPSPPEQAEVITSVGADPVIQMNTYNINSILFNLQNAGIRRFYTEFTDHGGELGIFLFFQMPLA